MKTQNLIITAVMILSTVFVFGQNTILLTDGSKIETESVTLNKEYQILIYKNKRGNDRYLYLADVFSVQKENGTEDIYYTPNSEAECSVEEYRNYLNGFEAGRSYNARSSAISGFTIGLATVFAVPTAGLSTLYAPVIPLTQNVICGTRSITQKNKINQTEQTYFNNDIHFSTATLNNDLTLPEENITPLNYTFRKGVEIPQEYTNCKSYIDGYQASVKKKRMTYSLLGSGLGLSVGIGAAILIFR